MTHEHECAGPRNRDAPGGVDDVARAMEPPPQAVGEFDFVYETLAHPRRRYVVYALKPECRWTLTGLTRTLVAWERDVPASAVAGGDREEMYTSLFHVHLPKLQEVNVVAFADGDGEIIVPAENAKPVLAVLEAAGASIDAARGSHPLVTPDRERS